MFINMLERSQAVDTILYIGNNPGHSRTQIVFSNGKSNARARLSRVIDLIHEGLAEARNEDGRWTIYLTDKGMHVFEFLSTVENTLKGR